MRRHQKFQAHPFRDLRVGINDVEREVGLVREYDRSNQWINIGDSGAPAFQNNWSNYGSPYVPARFMRSASGVVYVQGLIQHSTGGSGLTIFSIPEGFRPEWASIFSSLLYNGAYTPVELTVQSTGAILPGWAGTNPVWLILNSIIYPADW